MNHNEKNGPIIKFQNVVCNNILGADLSGLSDPYIIFGGYPANLLVEDPKVHKAPRSSTVMKTLNPVLVKSLPFCELCLIFIFVKN
jgi:hypothetical protein